MDQTQNTNHKIMTISFMGAGILIGLFTFVLLESASAIATGGFGRFISQEVVRHGVPVVIGIATFIVLQTNKTVLTWAEEVVVELRKIVWPSRKDTVAMTVMVCVMLLISGAVLGVFDVASAAVIDWLLHQSFFGLFA